jgi:CRP-like cAMP-binding protein
MAADLDLAAFGRFSRAFHQGDIIFAEFELGDTFYLIQSGRVQLLKIAGDIERTLDILYPSEMFGEMAILENSPRSATAIALDEVKVLEFNSQNFEILLLGNPQIALKLLKMFCKRIYDSKRRFMILTLLEPQAKIADVFLMLDETQPDIDKTTEKREFKTTVEGVAHWVGMSANEVRDILGHFENQHRVEILTDRIIVKNINDFSRFVTSRRNSSKA